MERPDRVCSVSLWSFMASSLHFHQETSKLVLWTEENLLSFSTLIYTFNNKSPH